MEGGGRRLTYQRHGIGRVEDALEETGLFRQEEQTECISTTEYKHPAAAMHLVAMRTS